MSAVLRPTILLDRDGTLTVERHYLSDPDQLALLPGTVAALRQLRQQGFLLVVVTNQSGIGRGYFSRAAVDRVHQRLRRLLADGDVTLDGIYLCPYAPDQPCDCRKPLPGLVHQAAAELGFDPRHSIVIGDKDADTRLGHAVGGRSLLVRTGWGRDTERAGSHGADAVVDDLPAAAAWIRHAAADLAR
jgi:D-glycero-D-manno-heptose 1,7-bisphosphate phosphatase